MTRLGIHGAAGRMGQRLIALAQEDNDLTVTAALEVAGHPELGEDAGTLAAIGEIGVGLTQTWPTEPLDVLIDFSAPDATSKAIDACVQRGAAMLIGTTGLTNDDHRRIDEAGQTIAVLQAPNMSMGVNVMLALAAQAADRLGDDYDIEIVEAHHRFKTDAPSGTALGLAQAICDATGKDEDRDLVYDRHGKNVPRQRGQIGMHALRLGDVAGRHTVSFATHGEELQLTHIATTRDVFARGALRTAKWLAGKPARRYRMADVLGLP